MFLQTDVEGQLVCQGARRLQTGQILEKSQISHPGQQPLGGTTSAGTYHVTEGVAKEDGMTVEKGPVSTPLAGLTGSTQE